MQTVANLLKRAHAELGELETALRENLTNQNLPDVLAGARKRLEQAAGHADAAIELDSLRPKEPAADKEPIKEPAFPFGADKKD